LLVAAYFLIQLLGFDRADWIDAYGGVPSSTLGNPNFVSAFVAIGFVSTLPLLVTKRTSFRLKVLIVFVSILEFYVTVESNSFQGLAIILIGFTLIAFSSLTRLLLKFDLEIRRLAAISAVFIFIAVFAFLIFRESLSIENSTLKARLDYWQAGLAMGLDAPIFGRGFDFFGESYLRYRSESAATRSPGLFTDSAHNYFIDLFAFGGFPLLVTTTLPILFVLLGIIKSSITSRIVTNQNQWEYTIHKCLFIVWIGFVFQALLSPFSIPLAYLGFLLTGYLYGRFNQTEQPTEGFVPLTKRQVSPKTASRRLTVNTIIVKVLLVPFFILFPILGLQPMIADAKFRDGIEQGNGDLIYRGALSQPKSFQTMSYAAEIFLQNKREDLARPIIMDMVEQNPENIVGWRLFERVSQSGAETAKAHAKILALDPKNPELKKS
jgi:O-antigen ligase